MTRPNSRPQATVRHQRNERGAIAAATAVVMGSMLVIASLVIDVGRDRVVSRDMQAMADVIALDVVRQLDGRPVESYGTLLTEAKNNSLKAQAGSLISLSNDEVEVEAVVANRDTGAWHTPANGEVPNAVWVHAIGHSAVRFLPSTAERTGIKRSALAMIGPPIACISAGATFAEIQQQGPLDTMLGKLLQNQGVDRLTVLDPYGLAALDMEIPLVDLAAKMGVGSVEEILTADISAHDFVLAISDVLPPKNDNKPNPVALLDAIVNGLPDTPGFRPGDILNLDTGGGTGTTLVINTFTLVQAVIMISNKEHFVDLPLKVSVPGLAKVAVSAAVVEAPQIACGPVGTTAQSAQVRVRVSADVTALGGLVASAKIAPLEIMVGEGSDTITDIRCTAGSPSVAIQAKTAVGKLKLRLLTELLLGLTDLEVAVPDLSSKPDGAAIGSSTTHNMSFSFPTDDLPPGQTAGTTFGSLGLSSISPIKIDVIGLPVGGLLDGIVKPLLGIIDPLVSSLLRPILDNLGVNVGTVRIQPTARPSCNEPFLIQ